MRVMGSVLPKQRAFRFAAENFTQQQLVKAVAQIQRERAEEFRKATQVAAYFRQQLLLNVAVENVNSTPFFWGATWENSPTPQQYRFKLLYSQYDPGPSDRANFFATRLKGKVLPGAEASPYRGEDVFEWDVSDLPEFAGFPQTQFPIRFEFYDAHAQGF